MAKNDENIRSHQAGGTQQTHSQTQRKSDGQRDRKRDVVVSTVKERPYAAAALATVAAGAAAFFLTRSKSDKPLMKWGQDNKGDHVKGAGAYKQQGSTTSDRSLETASTSPSSSAGVGAGTDGTSPSAVQAASLATTGSSTNSSITGSTGGTSTSGPSGTTGTSSAGNSSNSNPGAGNTAGAGISGGANGSAGSTTSDAGLDAASKTETKAGAISYGA